MVARPAPEGEEDSLEQQHMCLDAAYDSEPVRQELEGRSYEPHISPAEEKKRNERKQARASTLAGGPGVGWWSEHILG